MLSFSRVPFILHFKQWQSTYEDNGEFGYGRYTLQSQAEGLTGCYLNSAHEIQPGPVLGELDEGQNLKWWSGWTGNEELRA